MRAGKGAFAFLLMVVMGVALADTGNGVLQSFGRKLRIVSVQRDSETGKLTIVAPFVNIEVTPGNETGDGGNTSIEAPFVTVTAGNGTVNVETPIGVNVTKGENGTSVEVGDDGDIVDVETSANGTVSVEVGDMGSIVDVETSDNGTVDVQVLETDDEGPAEPSANPETPL